MPAVPQFVLNADTLSRTRKILPVILIVVDLKKNTRVFASNSLQLYCAIGLAKLLRGKNEYAD
jgi:hypothetical protein